MSLKALGVGFLGEFPGGASSGGYLGSVHRVCWWFSSSKEEWVMARSVGLFTLDGPL